MIFSFLKTISLTNAFFSLYLIVGLLLMPRSTIAEDLNQDWIQIGPDIDGERPSAVFGAFLTMSDDGTTLIVSVPNNDGDRYARVYQFSSFFREFLPLDTDILYGSTVALSGNKETFVVSNTENDNVRVYSFDGSAPYEQLGAQINGEARGDQFGVTLQMSTDGSTFAVGATFNNGVGSVRVYQFDASANKHLQVGSDIDGKSDNDLFGWSLGMSGDATIIAVGTLSNNYVRVYKLDASTSQYMQIGSDITGDANDISFGSYVTISGDGTTIVTGSPEKARVYKFDSSSNQFRTFGLGFDGGDSVAISQDGDTIVVGASFADYNGVARAGYVRVYKFDISTDEYAQLGSDLSRQKRDDYFGISVAMSASGTTIAIGAFGELFNGHVRIYNLGDKQLTEAPALAPVMAPTRTPCGLFGWSIFCPLPGKCGLFRRLLQLNGC